MKQQHDDLNQKRVPADPTLRDRTVYETVIGHPPSLLFRISLWLNGYITITRFQAATTFGLIGFTLGGFLMLILVVALSGG